ncbi:MAG: lysophospholipid acyltransferase family protein [Acidimicrobiia bacterium]
MSEVESKMADNSLVARLMYRFFRRLNVGFCRIWLRMRVEGFEHVPQSGAFVVAPVHRSYVDTPIVAVVTKRRLRYMGKDSLWKVKGLGWLLSSLGGFPVTRGTADREALKRCIEVLEGGEPLVLFPEGERKSGPIVQPLFDGAAYVAAKAGVGILPVGIGGSEWAMPKDAKFVRPRRVHVTIGPLIPPIVTEGGRVPRGAVKAMSEQLHAELQRLFDHAQAKVG